MPLSCADRAVCWKGVRCGEGAKNIAGGVSGGFHCVSILAAAYRRCRECTFVYLFLFPPAHTSSLGYFGSVHVGSTTTYAEEYVFRMTGLICNMLVASDFLATQDGTRVLVWGVPWGPLLLEGESNESVLSRSLLGIILALLGHGSEPATLETVNAMECSATLRAILRCLADIPKRPPLRALLTHPYFTAQDYITGDAVTRQLRYQGILETK